MKKILAGLVLALALAPRAFSAGVTAYSVGNSTGGFIVVLTTSPTSFYGISMVASAAGDTFTCWDSSTTAGLSTDIDASLGAVQTGQSSNAAPRAPSEIPVKALHGIACGADNPSDEALIYAAGTPSGLDVYSLGASTGTNLVVVSTRPASFWGISPSFSTANNIFKCWDSTSTSGLTLGSDTTLGGVMMTADNQGPTGPAKRSVAAIHGIVCGKNSAGSDALIYTAAP